MSEQYVTRTVTPELHRRSVVDATPVDMIEAQFTPPGGQTFERSHVCETCQFTYKESQMAQVSGKWYCTRLHHVEDASADVD